VETGAAVLLAAVFLEWAAAVAESAAGDPSNKVAGLFVQQSIVDL
jgi:hypothetical protein